MIRMRGWRDRSLSGRRLPDGSPCELVANVNTRYQEACVKDEALKNLKDMLDGKTSVPSSEKSSEENTSESVSDTVYDAESQADEA